MNTTLDLLIDHRRSKIFNSGFVSLMRHGYQVKNGVKVEISQKNGSRKHIV